jgi:predicted deacylase
MTEHPTRWGPLAIGGTEVCPGEVRDLFLPVSRDATPLPSRIPLRVIPGLSPGPMLFVTAGLHGDELNGVGIVKRLMAAPELRDLRGCLLLVPIANLYGFYEHTRYLPDGRDLNRCFPGDPRGSFAARCAAALFNEIVRKSDAGIDLHTAPRWRANLPHVRANLNDPETRALARAFATEVVLHAPSNQSTLRGAAQASGIPVLLLEAGDPFRFQPEPIERGVRGVRSVMRALGMLDDGAARPRYRVILKRTRWLRAEQSGVLEMLIKPGDLLLAGAPIATTCDPFGNERSTQISPYTALVLGVTTHPSVSPGDPLCHVGIVKRSLPLLEKFLGPARRGAAERPS